MRLFPSRTVVRRAGRHLVGQFFGVMAVLTVVFAVLLVIAHLLP